MLVTVVLLRIGLIVVPPISIILRTVVKNRGIILVRISDEAFLCGRSNTQT